MLPRRPLPPTQVATLLIIMLVTTMPQLTESFFADELDSGGIGAALGRRLSEALTATETAAATALTQSSSAAAEEEPQLIVAITPKLGFGFLAAAALLDVLSSWRTFDHLRTVLGAE